MLQQSNEWYKVRGARFTGSEMHKLMGIKGLGETGKTYAFEKACNIVFGIDEDEKFESFDMQRGNQLEPFAFQLFAEQKELDFLSVEKAEFFPFGDNIGASPDGIVGNNAVLEIKCPRPPKFFKLIANGVEAIDNEYFIQMQTEMLCTNSTHCYFFNYIIYNGVPMWHEIIVQRDDAFIEKIKERVLEAVIIRDNFIEQLISKKQF